MCLCTLLYTTAFLGLFLLVAMGKHILVICVIPRDYKYFRRILLASYLFRTNSPNFSPVKIRNLGCYGFYTKREDAITRPLIYGYSIYDYILTKHFLISSFTLSF